MTTLKIFKHVGSHILLVKWRNRWFYVGNNASTNDAFRAAVKAAGYKLKRDGHPCDIYQQTTLRAIKERYPQFNWEAIPRAEGKTDD